MIQRALHFARRHGLVPTCRRIWVALQRLPAAGQLVVYGCDLTGGIMRTPVNLTVERRLSMESLGEDRQWLAGQWVPHLVLERLSERFSAGATLWLGRVEGTLVAYGWTLQGTAIRPHYMPLLPGDVHLFDFQVVPGFRGRGLNGELVMQILEHLHATSAKRAWIECAPWNQSQIRSLSKTPFRPSGVVRAFTVFGVTMAMWGRSLQPPLQKEVCAPTWGPT